MKKINNKILKKSVGYRKGSWKSKAKISKRIKNSKKCYVCSKKIGGGKVPSFTDNPKNLVVNISRTIQGKEIPKLDEIREIYQKKKKMNKITNKIKNLERDDPEKQRFRLKKEKVNLWRNIDAFSKKHQDFYMGHRWRKIVRKRLNLIGLDKNESGQNLYIVQLLNIILNNYKKFVLLLSVLNGYPKEKLQYNNIVNKFLSQTIEIYVPQEELKKRKELDQTSDFFDLHFTPCGLTADVFFSLFTNISHKKKSEGTEQFNQERHMTYGHIYMVNLGHNGEGYILKTKKSLDLDPYIETLMDEQQEQDHTFIYIVLEKVYVIQSWIYAELPYLKIFSHNEFKNMMNQLNNPQNKELNEKNNSDIKYYQDLSNLIGQEIYYYGKYSLYKGDDDPKLPYIVGEPLWDEKGVLKINRNIKRIFEDIRKKTLEEKGYNDLYYLKYELFYENQLFVTSRIAEYTEDEYHINKLNGLAFLKTPQPNMNVLNKYVYAYDENNNRLNLQKLKKYFEQLCYLLSLYKYEI